MSFLGSIAYFMTEAGLKVLLSVVFAENTVPHMLNGKAIAGAIRAHTSDDCSRYTCVFDMTRPDNNAVDINEEESIDKAQDRHNRDERSDAIISLDINK